MRVSFLSEHSNTMHRGVTTLALAAALALAPAPALALEPLSAFLSAARSRSFDNREAAAVVGQRSAERDQSWLKLAPVATVSATYTRNQYESIVTIPSGPTTFRTATITPQDQGDLVLSATVPLVDVGAWERIGVANRSLEASRSRAESTASDVQKAVARDYYQLVAAAALVEAAGSSLDTARKNLAYVTSRKEAGVASELDQKRAVAEVERGRQSLADATYQARIAERALATASGRVPTTDGASTLGDDLSPEAPLAEWDAGGADALPAVRAQRDEARAQERLASATRMALVPSVAASAQERVTNAVGFGQQPYYAIAVGVTWRFDPSTFSAADAQTSVAVAARAREDRARQQARDDIHNAWFAVARDLDKARSARAGLEASTLASRIASDRFAAGTASFLDVTTAERDAFSAKVTLIQADADLAYARVALRLAAGRSIGGAQ